MEKRWIANPNVKEVDFLDIRIEKTERAIKQAFMELRAEKPLEKIRVKELCDRACINKSTFYAHYQDIYALANAMEDEMVEAVVASLPNLTARDVSERTEWLAREMFRAFVRHQNEINTLFADSRQGLFINRVEAALRAFFTGSLLGRAVYRAQLGKAVLDTGMVENYQIVEPAADIAENARALPQLGTLTILEGEE